MKNLQGWMILGIACLASCVGTTIPVQAQQTATAIVVKERLVEHVGDRLIIDMKLALDELSLSANRSLVCTPLIERGDSVRALPPVIVNGRSRQIQYDRSGRDAAANGEFVLRRYNGKEQTFDYHASIPFAKWMERSEVSLVVDFCGCGWEALSNDKSPLFPIRIAEPVVLRPLLAYVTPEAERVKERVKEGSAFLDFPVNRTEIYPEYRDNPSELRKILETVSSVKEDPYATITEVYIKGFASPEGTYKHNTYLAEHRAKALIEYVKGLYHFEQARFTVDFEPEDWAGLEERVENSSLADKEELLAIIRADEPKDYDRREAKLKALNGGASYRVLLRDIYPALRHSDYAVRYTIRSFTVEEARELIYSDPRQLSLNEMFRVAQTMEPGSDAYCEVFEIAVRMYPDDPVSNLNAANSALLNGDSAAARRYLAKAQEGPERRLAEGVASWLEGDTDRAATIFRALTNDVRVGEQARANLEQVED
mgnify:CR=1 FL=1